MDEPFCLCAVETTLEIECGCRSVEAFRFRILFHVDYFELKNVVLARVLPNGRNVGQRDDGEAGINCAVRRV